jgi:hypothetical protein
MLCLACQTSEEVVDTDVALVAPVACDADLPGPAMLEGTVEEVDHATWEQLVAEAGVEQPNRIDLLEVGRFERAIVNWMLGRKRGETLTYERAQKAGPMGEAVWASFGSGELDFQLLRMGLQHTYLCSVPIPGTLDELTERFGDYTTWPKRVEPCGLPKDAERHMWDGPGGDVVVAETVEEGEVREVEVIFRGLRDHGQLDFAVYRPNGALSNRSTFATRGGEPTTFGSPYICISCHAGDDGVDVPRPVGLGAGCVD